MKYTKEVNAQIVISLLKHHGIRKVIASPGTTNVALIGSIQNDPYFELISSVDERSAAYMAVGLAEASGEPVVISCTGATASRNYAPALTEAYYRKIPVLAITSMQSFSNVGHLVAQTIDRSSLQNDVAKLSVTLPIVKDKDDIWECEIKVNKAILELFRNGGGPVHINLPTTYTLPFVKGTLPTYRAIDRILPGDELPKLKGKVAIFVGSHKKMTESEIAAIDSFCESNNAAVFCDHTSNYNGKYRILLALLSAQEAMEKSQYFPDTVIHIGEVTGDYASLSMTGNVVWRVSPDGELRDTFRKLKYVFEMKEDVFFLNYSTSNKKTDYYELLKDRLDFLRKNIPNVPFSNIWVASQITKNLPKDSFVHLAILNSLRSWNYFEIPTSVSSAANVGGFGIDGPISTLVGASLNDRSKLHFCILGDLAFFYDMNVLGNRSVENNIRILLINNGKGTEFRQYNHHAAYFGEDADKYIAAANHYGNQSELLVRNYAEGLGYEYISARNKDEFLSKINRFLEPSLTSGPIVMEVFTNSDDESKALEKINNIMVDGKLGLKRNVKRVIGNQGVNILKRIFKS